MASDLQINMMTVSKAYGRLEADKILQRVRGKGMIVASQTPSGTVQERRAELRPQAESLVTRGHQLGLTNEQIVAVVKSILKERRS